jgi:ubiquinone/menaquinone biosynthesis C-methylase UbiE/uncharacterized protein YbaR (Trm112 family)
VKAADLRTLACPRCHGKLSHRGRRADDGAVDTGEIACAACACAWPVRGGLAQLYDEQEVRGSDRWMRLVYDRFGRLHEPAVRWLLPLLQMEGVSRDSYLRRLELGRLHRAGKRPLRILEVGVGDGANLPLIERRLPERLDVEIWGVDLSRGMIEICRRRLARSGGDRVRLLLADAHALPFRDASFDRVFHVGGIAAYRDPRRGLAEMARVARPGTPIVVVDERLDPGRSHGLYQRLMFRAITLYQRAPAAPLSDLPPGAAGVVDEQASRFYYCLTFRMPPAKGRRRNGLRAAVSTARQRRR